MHRSREIGRILASIFILFFWLLLIFPFEIPDEQSHYATVHYLVDQGSMPIRGNNNLSLEEQSVEYMFGIMTDGTNKYAHNPSHRPEFTETLMGKHEEEINKLNTNENRSTYTIHQSAIYPPLYYLITSAFYKISENANILIRLYTSRLSSLILTTATVYASYLVGTVLFGRNKRALALALLTLLYPMTTFIGVGVNSDNLHNLLFTIFTLLSLNLIKSGWKLSSSCLIGITIGLGIITKPQAYIMFPILALAIVARSRLNEWRIWPKHLSTIVLAVILIAGWQEFPKFISGSNYYANIIGETIISTDLLGFTKQFIKTHTSTLVVWYWGVFKWQNILMPNFLWWAGIRLFALALIGVLLKFIRDFKSRNFSWIGRALVFFILANIIYASAIFWFDWQYYQRAGESLGLQARYYMPLLTSQMAILFIGISELAWNQKIKRLAIRFIILFFLILQIAAAYTLAHSYYDTSSVNTFISQASQYKPWYAKGGWWYIWTSGYIFSLTYLCFLVLSEKKKLRSLDNK